MVEQNSRLKRIEILEADSPAMMAVAKELFLEYADSLEISLEFQDFDAEISDLPGQYSRPSGCIFLAFDDTYAVGCAALRKLEGGVCEMKRLYVRPAYRGIGLGKVLSKRIIMEAGEIGYRKMRLDTLASMSEAILLYKSMGFKEIGPYRHNPAENAVFMEISL